MTDPLTTKLKNFDITFGWLIRWLLLVLVGYAVLYADTRYVKREEVRSYIQELQQMRSEDMSQIYSRIESVRSEAMSADVIVRSLESRMARIEEQNKAISNNLERLIDKGR